MGACAGDWCVCVIVCLCFCWLSCGSRVEKQLFSGDVSSGEYWLWAVASHTGTKDLSPRGQTGHPMPGLASEQLPNQKTFCKNSSLATSSGASFSWFAVFSSFPPRAHSTFFFSFSSLLHSSYSLCLPHGKCVSWLGSLMINDLP